MFKTYAITDRHLFPTRHEFLGAIDRVARSGIGAIQLREKDLSDGDLLALAIDVRATMGPRTPLLINGRVDVALASGAQGVHLPSDGVPLHVARALMGPRHTIGVSCHTIHDVKRASGADYILFGPIFDTPSKRAFGPPLGLPALRRAVRAAGAVPVIAVGGISRAQMKAVRAAGAHGVAAIRAWW